VGVVDPFLIRSVGTSGQPILRLGVPLLDGYLDFVAGRCRPNTVLATAYDLKVFFTVVGKPPERVSGADVLGFITAAVMAVGCGRWLRVRVCRRGRCGVGCRVSQGCSAICMRAGISR
jgi:hypothetical protein